MDIFRDLLFKRYSEGKVYPFQRCGVLRINGTAEFTDIADGNTIVCAGKFQFMIMVPIGITATVVLYCPTRTSFTAGDTRTITLKNNSATSAMYQLIEMEGVFYKLGTTGAGVTCETYFYGWACGI